MKGQDTMETKRLGHKGSRKPGRNDPCPCGSGDKYKNCCYMPPAIDAATAAFGVLAWLTTRDVPMILGATHDASQAAMAAALFCRANGLGDPMMMDSLKMPDEELPEVDDDERLGDARECLPDGGYKFGLERALQETIDDCEAMALAGQEVKMPDLRRLVERCRKALNPPDESYTR